MSPEEIAAALYRGILRREPDAGGLKHFADIISRGRGAALARVIDAFLSSGEFRPRLFECLVPIVELPDLTKLLPQNYETQRAGEQSALVYAARSDADIRRIESLIAEHRYYDKFGIWTPTIDLDKEIIAAIVRGLGARSCFELGCFTGPVLSLLAEAGIEVAGAEVSHLALALAYSNIRQHIRFGDLLSLPIDRKYDVLLCMDVLEHLSPLKLPDYIDKIKSLCSRDGYVYINSPMFGKDRVFGTSVTPYLEEWISVGDASYWRHLHCDEKGWPLHGHLVWASPLWWECEFGKRGLVRDTVIEAAIQAELSRFFLAAPGRRSLFVLRCRDNARPSASVAADVRAALVGLTALREF